MTDRELYIYRHTVLAGVKSNARAAETIAEIEGLSVDSVRGRLSRAATPSNKLAVAKWLAQNITTDSPAVTRQKKVISRADATFAAHQATLEYAADEVCGVFMSDLHIPYTRWDAVDLALQIVQDVRPAYVSGLNDALDNAGFGRWDDRRSTRGRVWSSDVTYLRQAEEAWYTLLKSALPDNALILGIAGNHDNWYYRNLRNSTPQSAEKEIADYMEWLEQLGVLLFTRGHEENAVQLSPKLVWWHGQFASVRAETNAANTLAQFMEDGVGKTVVVGHTHRPAHIQGDTIKFPGLTYYNAPCLSRLKRLPWMKRDPKGWGLGIVINYWIPGTRQERGYLVRFWKEGDLLVTDFNGKRYTTKFDDSLPDEYL